MSDEITKCELCGEPMPEGEQMFKYHGSSGPCPKPPLVKPPGKAKVQITGIWLRRIGDYAEVLFEVDGVWRMGIKEHHDGNFSHILEGNGMMDHEMCPPDELTAKE